MAKILDDLKDSAWDLIDKTSDTKSRVAHTAHRVAKLSHDKVSKRTIAAQLSDNSSNGTEYTVADVDTLLKVHQDCETKVLITVKQTRALSRDQKQNGINPDTSTVLA